MAQGRNQFLYNQSSFIGGLKSSVAEGNTNEEHYLNSCSELVNFIPEYGGSLRKRGGFRNILITGVNNGATSGLFSSGRVKMFGKYLVSSSEIFDLDTQQMVTSGGGDLDSFFANADHSDFSGALQGGSFYYANGGYPLVYDYGAGTPYPAPRSLGGMDNKLALKEPVIPSFGGASISGTSFSAIRIRIFDDNTRYYYVAEPAGYDEPYYQYPGHYWVEHNGYILRIKRGFGGRRREPGVNPFNTTLARGFDDGKIEVLRSDSSGAIELVEAGAQTIRDVFAAERGDTTRGIYSVIFKSVLADAWSIRGPNNVDIANDRLLWLRDNTMFATRPGTDDRFDDIIATETDTDARRQFLFSFNKDKDPSSSEILPFLNVNGKIFHILSDRTWRFYHDQGVDILRTSGQGSLLETAIKNKEGTLLADPRVKPISIDGSDIVITVDGKLVEYFYEETDDRYKVNPLYEGIEDLLKGKTVAGLVDCGTEPRYIGLAFHQSNEILFLKYSKVRKVYSWFKFTVPKIKFIAGMTVEGGILRIVGWGDGDNGKITYVHTPITSLFSPSHPLDFVDYGLIFNKEVFNKEIPITQDHNWAALAFNDQSIAYFGEGYTELLVRPARGALVPDRAKISVGSNLTRSYVGLKITGRVKTMPLVRTSEMDRNYSSFGHTKYWPKMVSKVYALVESKFPYSLLLEVDNESASVKSGFPTASGEMTEKYKPSSANLNGGGYTVRVGLESDIPFPVRVGSLGVSGYVNVE